MSWTSDVGGSLEGLDCAPRRLRRFGMTVGSVLFAFALWLALRNRQPLLRNAAGILGLALLLAGATFPARLRAPYRLWMALAFALGWVMSRVALFALFALVLTPIAMLARVTGKRFLGAPADPDAATYWVRREVGRPAHYDKMY